MFPFGKRPLFLLVVALCIFRGFSAASDYCQLTHVNRLDQEIVAVRVKYSTPYDEPRHDYSQIFLPAGEEYRIGVQGTTLPEAIYIDLATKSFVFTDLAGLNPESQMVLSYVHEEGRPLIRRLDAPGEAAGTERDYLTLANRPNAVDKDFAMDAESLDELLELIRETIGEQREHLGELETFDIEAGPIWNHEHALKRCPEVVEEWNGENDREARWTGHWRTTVSGKMSVCACATGTTDEEATLTFENEGWGAVVRFPVFWKEWAGAGLAAQQEPPDAGLGMILRFRLPETGVAEMLGELLEDLRVDGFRPVVFRLGVREQDGDGEWDERVTAFDFREEEVDKWDALDQVVQALTAGYEGPQLRGGMTWIEDEAFEKAKEQGMTGEMPATRGVFCRFSKGTFEIAFVPDGRELLE